MPRRGSIYLSINRSFTRNVCRVLPNKLTYSVFFLAINYRSSSLAQPKESINFHMANDMSSLFARKYHFRCASLTAADPHCETIPLESPSMWALGCSSFLINNDDSLFWNFTSPKVDGEFWISVTEVH